MYDPGSENAFLKSNYSWFLGPENYPYDGAFVRGNEVLNVDSGLKRFSWARQADTSWFLPFDVKFLGYRMSSSQDTGYVYSTGHSLNKEAEVYVIVFQDVDDYMAFVPNRVWDDTSGRRQMDGHGLQALLSKVPLWALPFMVYKDHYGAAVSALTASCIRRMGA